jgi:hypothetical protein
MFLEHHISAIEKDYRAAIFTVSISTNRLLSNNACSTSTNACCAVTFSKGNNTSILICKQIVCITPLADYRVPIMFNGKHRRVCDASDNCHRVVCKYLGAGQGDERSITLAGKRELES